MPILRPAATMYAPTSTIAAAIIPDRHARNLQGQVESWSTDLKRAARSADVRRPTRGIQLKEDTYATLKVVRGDGHEIPLVNAGSRAGEIGPDGKMMSNTYANFLIQHVTEERVEKSQVVETFGEAFIFFYGQRPRVITVQGVLINTFDFNWEAEWWHNYDNYLRGTRCVEQDARVYLTYDDTMVSGYIMSTSAAKNSTERNFVPFVFQLFVTDYTSITKVGNPDPDQRGIEPTNNLETFGYRPDVQAVGIPKQFTTVAGMALPPQPGKSMSLISGLTASALNIVNSAFNAAANVAKLVTMPLSYLDSFLGNLVRVPYGFEGAVVFDETKVALDLSTQLMSPIRYTAKFGDNYDEFVGGYATQYDSSSIENGDKFTSTVGYANTQRINDALTNRARAEWEALGLIPPQGLLTDVLSMVSKTPIGMKMIATARNALVKPTTIVSGAIGQAVASAAPIAVGANQVGFHIAVADNVFGRVNPQASQALDRAAGPAASVTMSALQSVSNRINQQNATNVNSFKNFVRAASGKTIGGS